MNIDEGTISGTRPPMPTASDVARSIHQQARLKILMEDWEKILYDWMKTRVQEARLATWGAPDTAVNTLADICRQLSTPGLYGARAEVRHVDPSTVAFVGPGGEMDRAGYWTMMQHIQYLTGGIGDFFVQAGVDDGALTYRPVAPHDIWIDPDPERPDRAIRLWELRLRMHPETRKWIYAWDQWDLGEPTSNRPEIRPPSRKIIQASGGAIGEDISNFYGLPVGGLEGDAAPDGDRARGYWWRDLQGKPFLPFGVYRAIDSKQTWNHHHRRGATRGALNAATYWTFAGHCAKDASGKTVLVSGLEPVLQAVQAVGTPGMTVSLQLSPGSIVYHKAIEGAQPFVSEIGPGAELDKVVAFARVYESQELKRWGIEQDDALKDSADPQSGAAKFISRQGKREYANQVKPLFERADLEMIRMSAALLRLSGAYTFPETGYSISYAEIPESPAEREARRKQIEWEESRGMISPIEAYMRLHPGVSRVDAETELVKAAVEKARLAAAVDAAVAGAGLTPPIPANTRTAA